MHGAEWSIKCKIQLRYYYGVVVIDDYVGSILPLEPTDAVCLYMLQQISAHHISETRREAVRPVTGRLVFQRASD